MPQDSDLGIRLLDYTAPRIPGHWNIAFSWKHGKRSSTFFLGFQAIGGPAQCLPRDYQAEKAP